MSDFELHLSTIFFPEVRLKRFIECRSADGGPREMTLALPALWKGIFYDSTALEEADRLTSQWSKALVMNMQRSAALDGIRARGSSWTMSRLAEQVLELSSTGLERHDKDEAQFLEPLQRVIAQKLTRADHLVEAYQKAKGKWTSASLQCAL